MHKLKAFLKTWYYRFKLREPRIPKQVWIENTNFCNAHCVMCPRTSLTRPLSIMSVEAFQKIIRDIAPYAHQVERLHVHNFGEPLLDKEIVRKIRIAKDHGFPYVYFVTNASVLTAQKARDIIESGLDEFKVSFYGTNPQTYNATMAGLDFDITIQNLKTFFKIRKELNSQKPKVVIQYIPQETNKMLTGEFKLLFKGLLDFQLGDTLTIGVLHNYGSGKNFVNVKGRPCAICAFPWAVMMILCDSRVGFCCFDFDGVQIIGNAQEESAIDIWNSKRMSGIRRDFKNLDYRKYPVCLRCQGSHWL